MGDVEESEALHAYVEGERSRLNRRVEVTTNGNKTKASVRVFADGKNNHLAARLDSETARKVGKALLSCADRIEAVEKAQRGEADD